QSSLASRLRPLGSQSPQVQLRCFKLVGVSRIVGHCVSSMSARSQIVEQGFGFAKITRLEAFTKPPIEGRNEIAGLSAIALLAPKPAKANGSAQFPAACPLCACDLKGCAQARLGPLGILVLRP